MATRGDRSKKVERIFQQFDSNRDGGLNKEELTALVVTVNPRVKFSHEQISAILDEVFRTYDEFIDGEKGLTLDGLLRTYDDGAGDVDRDFDALGLELNLDESRGVSMVSESQSCRSLSVFFLVLEAISVGLDLYGKSKKKFLLVAFLLSAFGFIITIYAFIRKRTTAAYKQKAERELAWVEVVFSVFQLVTLFIQYILAVASVKNSYNISFFPLVFALLLVVFAFKKEKRVNNHMIKFRIASWGTPQGYEANELLQPV